MVHFKGEILPLIRRKLHGVPVRIVGAAPPEIMARLAGRNVQVTGWVPDTSPYLDASRVSVAPLRYGAGMKGKIGEALSRRLPVVTTPIGAEGMGLEDGRHALVAEGPEAFAEAVVRAHTDARLWQVLSEGGVEHLAERCSSEAASRRLEVVLSMLLDPRAAA